MHAYVRVCMCVCVCVCVRACVRAHMCACDTDQSELADNHTGVQE